MPTGPTDRCANVRESLAQNLKRLAALGRARAHRLLPPVRCGHAGICLRRRHLRCGSAPRLCPGIRGAEIGELGRARSNAGARRWRYCRRRSRCRPPRCTRGARASRRKAPSNTASSSESRRAVPTARSPATSVSSSQKSAAEVLGQFPRLSRHGSVPRSPAGARHAARVGARRRFLNRFCYTAARRVRGGRRRARSTVSIDLSNTYLDWARDNLVLNWASPPLSNELQRADCLTWLEAAGSGRPALRPDLLDRSTFSNSKAWKAYSRRAARPVGMIRRCLEAAAQQRTPGVFHQRHALQTRSSGADGPRDRRHHRGHDPEGLLSGTRLSHRRSSIRSSAGNVSA